MLSSITKLYGHDPGLFKVSLFVHCLKGLPGVTKSLKKKRCIPFYVEIKAFFFQKLDVIAESSKMNMKRLQMKWHLKIKCIMSQYNEYKEELTPPCFSFIKTHFIKIQVLNHVTLYLNCE